MSILIRKNIKSYAMSIISAVHTVIKYTKQNLNVILIKIKYLNIFYFCLVNEYTDVKR